MKNSLPEPQTLYKPIDPKSLIHKCHYAEWPCPLCCYLQGVMHGRLAAFKQALSILKNSRSTKKKPTRAGATSLNPDG